MVRRPVILPLLALSLFGLSAAAHAAPASGFATFPDQVVRQYIAIAAGWVSGFQSAGIGTFWLLAFIHLAWQGLKLAFRATVLEEFVAEAVSAIMFIGFGTFVLLNGPSLLGKLIDSFRILGRSVGGVGLQPSEIVQSGLTMAGDARSVYSDQAAQTRVVNDAFAIMDAHASGRQALKDWYSEHDPFKRARDETVSVAVASVIPLSADTWRIEWTETKHATQGGGADVYENWQARVTFTVSPPTDDPTIMKNPAGIWIESWDWSQRQ